MGTHICTSILEAEAEAGAEAETEAEKNGIWLLIAFLWIEYFWLNQQSVKWCGQ